MLVLLLRYTFLFYTFYFKHLFYEYCLTSRFVPDTPTVLANKIPKSPKWQRHLDDQAKSKHPQSPHSSALQRGITTATLQILHPSPLHLLQPSLLQHKEDRHLDPIWTDDPCFILGRKIVAFRAYPKALPTWRQKGSVSLAMGVYESLFAIPNPGDQFTL